MIYTIENNQIKVAVSDTGAELMSIQLKKDGCEYLWQGNPEYWSGRAYNLFPICGRLTEGKYTYNGKTYEMNLHGFTRKTLLKVSAQSGDSISFNLKANENTLKMYPFDFDLTITYTLEGTSVKTLFTVKNNGGDVMPFAVGGHPGFNVPLGGEGVFEDYYLEFACEKPAKAIVMSPTCYTTRETVPFALEKGKILRLKHNLFDNDAIVLQDMCKKITLKSVSSDKSVTLEYPDMNYLGLWHKPDSDAPYICIEPWYSVPAYDGEVDDLSSKRDMVRLESGRQYQNAFTITVK